MNDISIYFKEIELYGNRNEKSIERIEDSIHMYTDGHFPDITKSGIAIFDVPEYRNSNLHNGNDYQRNFRKKFYQLYKGFNWDFPIYDLGTISEGKEIEDTFYAVSSVCQELIKKNVIPIIIGGTQDLTKAIYSGYEKLEQLVNLTAVDNQLDLGDIDKRISPDGWLNHILLHKPSYLFNYSNIGAQSHYISPKTLDLFEELYFDIYRLGEVNENITGCEPFLRNTDVLSFDLTCIRASEFQNPSYTSPNGLFANEACRIMRYAGISDKLTSVGIFNYYNREDGITDEIVAQLIWYFIEGYSNRKGDFPIGSKKTYTKYTVYIEELDEEIIFYKSDKSGRWWIEIPYPGRTESKFLRHQLVPCEYKTYEEAMNGEIPDLWWKTYQKFV